MLLRGPAAVCRILIPFLRAPCFNYFSARAKTSDSRPVWGAKKNREKLLVNAKNRIMSSPDLEIILFPLRVAVKEQV